MKPNVSTLLLVALILSLSAGTPSFAADGLPEPWKKYLSPTEQTTLAELSAQEIEEPPQQPDDPQAMLKIMREGFEEFVAGIAPNLGSVKKEPFEEKGVRGLWMYPENAAEDRVLLYFHGGGYVVGSSATGAGIAGVLADEAGIAAFVLDYPLAPEFPYPAALDNAVNAYRMLLEKYEPAHIVLAGDSAGGGLVLAVLLNIRDEGLPMPASAYLLSPWTDLGVSFASHETKKDVDSVIERGFLENLASAYAGEENLKDPRISPAFADLRGLPPLLVHVGSFETLLDDALTIVRNAAIADVPVKFTVWPGYYHVFQMHSGRLEGARKALEDGAAFFRDTMDGTLLRPDSQVNK